MECIWMYMDVNGCMDVWIWVKTCQNPGEQHSIAANSWMFIPL